MGIEGIFNSLSRNKFFGPAIKLNIKEQIKCQYFNIDFTSILYTISTQIEKDLGYILYSIIIGYRDEKLNILCAKWGFVIDNETTAAKFNTYFKDINMEEKLVEYVDEYIVGILNNFINKNTLTNIYISMDGVPQMSKIVEQKKRRYTNLILNDIKKAVSAKYIEEKIIKLDSNRESYENNKVSCDRSKFLASSSFMKMMGERLGSQKFHDLLKNTCKNLEEIKITTSFDVGEGEKKIMEKIIEEGKEGDYVIFSPDGDLIVLGLIMYNMLSINHKKTEMNILRYNQQNDNYDSIDIGLLTTNLHNYVINISKLVLEKHIVGLDLAVVFTLFGNDFIPKLEAINVGQNLDMLIEYYCDVIMITKRNFVDCQKYEYVLNNENIYNLFARIGMNEEQLMQGIYLSQFKNFKFLKSVLGDGLFIELLTDYLNKANEVFRGQYCIEPDKLMMHIIEKYGFSFIRQFIQIESKKKLGDVSALTNEQLCIEFANILVPGVKPRLTFGMRDNTVEDEYHIENIMKTYPHPEMKLGDYDKEMYKIDKMMDEWVDIFQKNRCNSMNAIILESENEYKISQFRSQENETILYYFNLFNLDIRTQQGLACVGDIVKEYMTGIYWVFDFYFNRNDAKKN